ncbi:hypothetical protein OSTOST_04586 [Ostertagia ostertagi]
MHSCVGNFQKMTFLEISFAGNRCQDVLLYGHHHRNLAMPGRYSCLLLHPFKHVDVVRDLLQQLAVLHTISMKHTGWNTTVADLPPSYYSSLVSNYNDVVNFFERHDVDHSRFVETGKYFTAEYLHDTYMDAADKAPPRVFVHGEPYASNIFVVNDSNKIAAVIDWTVDIQKCGDTWKSRREEVSLH